jgi:hypothetical protein
MKTNTQCSLTAITFTEAIRLMHKIDEVIEVHGGGPIK